MNIALEFTYHTDIIFVPDFIGDKINKYRKKFDKWLYDKNNNHGNWILREGRKVAVSFDTNTFVDYLNNVHLNNHEEKAFVVQEKVKEISPKIPTLFF